MTTHKKITKATPATTKKAQAVFYRLPGGKEPVREWLRGDELTDDDRSVVGADIRKVEWRHPVGMPLVRAMGGGLFELRSSIPSGNEIRLLFIVHKAEMIILHGFIKKTRVTPRGDLDLALDRFKDWKKHIP